MSKFVVHSLKAAFLTVAIFIGSGLVISRAETHNMPFRSSLHDAALRQALGDSVLSLAHLGRNGMCAMCACRFWNGAKKCCGTMRQATVRAKALIIVTARSNHWLGPKKLTLRWVAISRACMAFIGWFICAMVIA